MAHHQKGPARNPYTKEDVTNLSKYLAIYCPHERGRLGNKIYQDLEANVDGKWPWSARHPWSSWREYYKKNITVMNRKIREYQLEKGIIEPNSENEEDAKPNPKRKRHVIETVESPNRRKRAKQSNHRSPLPAESKPALQIVAPVRPSSEVRGVENDDHPAGSEDYGREIFATQESDSVEDVVGDDIHETADMGVGSDGEVWDRDQPPRQGPAQPKSKARPVLRKRAIEDDPFMSSPAKEPSRSTAPTRRHPPAYHDTGFRTTITTGKSSVWPPVRKKGNTQKNPTPPAPPQPPPTTQYAVVSTAASSSKNQLPPSKYKSVEEAISQDPSMAKRAAQRGEISHPYAHPTSTSLAPQPKLPSKKRPANTKDMPQRSSDDVFDVASPRASGTGEEEPMHEPTQDTRVEDNFKVPALRSLLSSPKAAVAIAHSKKKTATSPSKSKPLRLEQARPDAEVRPPAAKPSNKPARPFAEHPGPAEAEPPAKKKRSKGATSESKAPEAVLPDHKQSTRQSLPQGPSSSQLHSTPSTVPRVDLRELSQSVRSRRASSLRPSMGGTPSGQLQRRHSTATIRSPSASISASRQRSVSSTPSNIVPGLDVDLNTAAAYIQGVRQTMGRIAVRLGLPEELGVKAFEMSKDIDQAVEWMKERKAINDRENERALKRAFGTGEGDEDEEEKQSEEEEVEGQSESSAEEEQDEDDDKEDNQQVLHKLASKPPKLPASSPKRTPAPRASSSPQNQPRVASIATASRPRPSLTMRPIPIPDEKDGHLSDYTPPRKSRAGRYSRKSGGMAQLALGSQGHGSPSLTSAASRERRASPPLSQARERGELEDARIAEDVKGNGKRKHAVLTLSDSESDESDDNSSSHSNNPPELESQQKARDSPSLRGTPSRPSNLQESRSVGSLTAEEPPTSVASDGEEEAKDDRSDEHDEERVVVRELTIEPIDPEVEEGQVDADMDAPEDDDAVEAEIEDNLDADPGNDDNTRLPEDLRPPEVDSFDDNAMLIDEDADDEEELEVDDDPRTTLASYPFSHRKRQLKFISLATTVTRETLPKMNQWEAKQDPDNLKVYHAFLLKVVRHRMEQGAAEPLNFEGYFD